ncbi:hypothetical protein [Rhodococcus sp. EPR-157]|uniref:hypothetical protein n=1 Tax=Rhodococcus sp. EPR-157 TaxID=1813677 RepID=UPI000A7880A7|nr:hypothetical protein [Rhodococcus sp. EPR-157]
MSLRLDAAYCAATAILVAMFATLLADALGTSPVVLLVVALLVGVWAAILRFGSTRFALRPMLWTVMSANVVGAVAIGLLALVVPNAALSILIAAISLEVAAFACSQALSLRTL